MKVAAKCPEAYLALFHQLRQHNDDIDVVLVDHSPKVISGFLFWTLAGNVLVVSRVSLKRILYMSGNVSGLARRSVNIIFQRERRRAYY